VVIADPADFLKWLPFILVFSLTGQPAASVPAGWTEDGLPVGLQIVGRPYHEVTVCRAAPAFEEATFGVTAKWLALSMKEVLGI